MEEEKIRNSFQKIKEDIWYLSQEIALLNENLEKINEKIEKMIKNEDFNISTNKVENQTLPPDFSTHHPPFKPLKHQNLTISTGNQGASTDRQTDRQTDRHPPISYAKTRFLTKNEEKTQEIDRAAEILDSLDNLKKEIRLKFKKLTGQEMLIFSTIYQIEEESGPTSYMTIAHILGITQSSVRDHVGKFIKKGIPVEKKREGNKRIQLSISPNLRKITSLSTILQLRDI